MGEIIEDNIYGFIYKITNTINGKIYVGQHKGKEFGDYWGSGSLLHRAYKKYGIDAFIREIIAFASFKDELNFMECYYIQELNSMNPNGYNIATGGRGGYTGETTEESRRKISEFLKGRPKSEEHKRKLSLAKKGKRAYIPTVETRKRISASHMGIEPWNKGKGKPVDQFTLDGEYIRTWSTMAEAKESGFNISKICECINGKRKHHRHFLWRYNNG